MKKTTERPRIAYDDLGNGEPALLLLPGWCSSRDRWHEVAALCASGRRVLSLEWRGHGDSDPPPGDFGTAELVADAVAVIAASGVDMFVACSGSHAGWVAIELRRRFPQRIPKLVHVDWILVRPPDRFIGLIERLTSPAWEEARLSLLTIWGAGSDDPGIHATLAVMQEHGEEMWRRAGREIAAAYAQEGSPLEALLQLEPPPPVLHLYGQPQNAAYLEEQEQFAARHPWFSVSKLDTSTHFSMVESPEQVAGAIQRFIGLP